MVSEKWVDNTPLGKRLLIDDGALNTVRKRPTQQEFDQTLDKSDDSTD
jgi:hypothetical protein